MIHNDAQERGYIGAFTVKEKPKREVSHLDTMLVNLDKKRDFGYGKEKI